MNDELPKLPSIDFEGFDVFDQQIAAAELREDSYNSYSRQRTLQAQIVKNNEVNVSKIFFFGILCASIASLTYFVTTGSAKDLADVMISNNNNSTIASASIKGIQDTKLFNAKSPNKIAYVTGGNVWAVDSAGKKKQITNDAGALKLYKNVEWKTSDEITYTSCFSGECTVYVFSLLTNTAIPVISLPVPQINKIKWLPIANSLLINYVKPDGVLENIMWANGEQKILRQYNKVENHTPDFNDEIDFVFSDDGKYFAAINTLVDENEDQVLIYDSNANQIATIPAEANFPVFNGLNNIYFKSENKIFKGKIGTLNSQVILDSFNGFEMQVTKDGNKIIYWNLESGEIPVSSFYDVTTKEIKNIASSFKSPKWINEKEIIGLQVNNYEGLYSYQIQKLASTDIDGNIKVLEESSVSEFNVEGI